MLRPSNRQRYKLTASQFKSIQDVGSSLAPDLKHSFMSRAHAVLTVSSIGDCTDKLVEAAIRRGLDEMGAAA